MFLRTRTQVPRSPAEKPQRGPRITASPFTPGKELRFGFVISFVFVPFSSLLKNEILGAQIEDFKESSEERRAMAPIPEGRNLFSYRPKR